MTANLYDNNSKRFDAQFGFEIKDLLLEAGYRRTEMERTWREATSGKEDGYPSQPCSARGNG